MIPLLTLVLAFSIPPLILIGPGLFLLRAARREKPYAFFTRLFLLSFTIATLVSTLAVYMHIPLRLVGVLLAAWTLWNGIRLFQTWSPLPRAWKITLALFLALYVLFSGALFWLHTGLPSGDSQKAIIWAEQILATGNPPQYQTSPAWLNRDPVDFYTPGLHALTALIMSTTTHSLEVVGLMAIALSLAAAVVAGAYAELFQKDKSRGLSVFLTVVFVLTNLRFLRYLKEPGYHYQNIVGEFLLFGLLLLSLSLIQRWRTSDAFLALLVALTLPLTHQFSAFLTPFLLLAPMVIFCIHQRAALPTLYRQSPITVIGAGVGIIGLILCGFALGLQRKIPHLFTSTPHLITSVPPLADYAALLGVVPFMLGIGGLVWLLLRSVRKSAATPAIRAFVLAAITLFLLTQGPRFGVDIPSVRTLFYAIIPLSIASALFLSDLIDLARLRRRFARLVSLSLLAVLIVVPAVFNLTRAYTLDHLAATNSTLTPALQELNRYLTSHPSGTVLVDDPNRRAASWLVLSGHPMVTRLAANLETQMQESSQSALRFDLYLNQLNFEKIFSAGSRAEISSLAARHNIRWITGIDGASTEQFLLNPHLAPVAHAENITLFEVNSASSSDQETDQTLWLLRPTTLVNDIGDNEDTFKHLPASLRSTQLSAPLQDRNQSFRTTTAAYVPLLFNVGDYVKALWSKQYSDRPDISLELYIQFTERPSQLRLRTPSGEFHPVVGHESLLKLAPHEVPFDSQGFLALILENPTHAPVGIDLIALGLARTP